MWNNLFVENSFQTGSCISLQRGGANTKVPFTGIKELSSALICFHGGLFCFFLMFMFIS